MNDLHVTRSLLSALERGDLGHSQVIRSLIDHVLDLCRVCHQERESFLLECALGPSGQLAVAAPVLSWLLTIGPEFEGRKRQAEKCARRDLRDLLALAPEERAGRIERSRARFRHPELVELLLAEAHRRIRASPWEAHELAQLALEVSWQLEVAGTGVPRLEAVALRARAQLHSGNALRVQGEFAAAEREVSAARELAHAAGVTDLGVIAELDWLEGVLRGALGQSDSAVRLLERAILFSELGNDPHRAAVARLSLGALYQERADPEHAVTAIYPIVDDLDEQSEPLLALAARHNLILCLCELGRFLEARGIFLRSEPLYARFDDFWTRLRRRWAEARIERGVGHFDHALDLLYTVREGFLDEDVRSDAAIASREIAEVLHTVGRTEEALAAVRFAQEVFVEQGVGTEVERTAILIAELEERAGLPRRARPPSTPPVANAPIAVPSARQGHVHVTREVLRAQRAGRIRGDDVNRMYLEHLPALCPRCASEDGAEPVRADEPAVANHASALSRIALRLPLLVRRLEREEARARRRLGPLLALPPEQRLATVAALPAGPLGFALADLLLASSNELLAADAPESRNRAELAGALADRLLPTSEGPPRLAVAELQARASLVQGEALRRSRELARADRCFVAARAVARAVGILDPELQADLDFGEAMLRRDQARLPAAIRLFRRAATQFRSIRSVTQALRAQIELGASHRQAGNAQRSLEILLETLGAIDPSGPAERSLAALAHQHAALAARELGRDHDARRHLETRRTLIDGLPLGAREGLSLPIAMSSD